jgi:hypothetical protein
MASDDDRIVQIIPGTGWRSWWYDHDEQKAWCDPLVAWGLREDGTVVALDFSTDGVAWDPTGAADWLGVWPAGQAPDADDIAAMKERKHLSSLKTEETASEEKTP